MGSFKICMRCAEERGYRHTLFIGSKGVCDQCGSLSTVEYIGKVFPEENENLISEEEISKVEYSWQPMETAPKKDEEMILVWDGDYWCPMPVFFESTDDVWMLFGHKEILTPIAWMPLPDPPRFDN